MIEYYNVYVQKPYGKIIISLSSFPKTLMKYKKKYVGVMAKKEAIFRLTGKTLPEEWLSRNINDYVSCEICNTSLWSDYSSILNEVRGEEEVFFETFDFQYQLKVVFKDDIFIKDREDPVFTYDERIIYMLLKELLGAPVKYYKGIKNPIVSIEKIFD